jgi:hypothetical protein
MSGPYDQANKKNMTAWIDRANYEHLIEELQISPDPEVIYVSGIIRKDKRVFLDEWYRLPEGHVDMESGSLGNYSIVFRDHSDKILSDVGFNPIFAIPDFPQELPFAPFGFLLEFPDETAKIQLRDNLDKLVLAERVVSTNPPRVNLTLDSNTFLEGNRGVEIAWEGFDSDNDSLEYILAYSNNSEDWLPITVISKQSEFTWNASALPAGNYTLKITATDGINTNDNTVPFAILPKNFSQTSR